MNFIIFGIIEFQSCILKIKKYGNLFRIKENEKGHVEVKQGGNSFIKIRFQRPKDFFGKKKKKIKLFEIQIFENQLLKASKGKDEDVSCALGQLYMHACRSGKDGGGTGGTSIVAKKWVILILE